MLTGEGMQDARCRMQDEDDMTEGPSGYHKLEVFNLAKTLAVEIHKATLEDLPKFEMFEQGSQVRRSSKSIVAGLVEGFGRRAYKADFVRYITYAIASCDETKAHLDLLFETGSLTEAKYSQLKNSYEALGAKLYAFRQAVLAHHAS